MKADPRRKMVDPAIVELRNRCSKVGFQLVHYYELYFAGRTEDVNPQCPYYIIQLTNNEIMAKGELHEVREFVERCENLKVFL